MDTGPGFGDILLENTYLPGTLEYYEIEANNNKYYKRRVEVINNCKLMDEHPELFTDEQMLGHNLAKMHNKTSLGAFFLDLQVNN